MKFVQDIPLFFTGSMSLRQLKTDGVVVFSMYERPWPLIIDGEQVFVRRGVLLRLVKRGESAQLREPNRPNPNSPKPLYRIRVKLKQGFRP